ncbi:alpha/beta hydrolase [Kribbella italica]|uniref:Pimeloyl-ACP methyl ester carboxylesterase n=1 Tax=Kribbella italica TaxID=1540520 RepID=A0A7W9J4B1_9ACTN|nr:pimeloyl-ACP methyl ester carboxylesterase [Kribbella italica]
MKTGYAPVNGLEMYYEIHGEGGTPLLLLHGGLFNIDLQFGELIPKLAETRQVIATDFQAHGRTNDIDRLLTCPGLASDVMGLLEHLGLEQVDVFGFSVGAGVAQHLAIVHPELIRKAIISSASFQKEGDRPENAAVGEMKVEMIAGTPMEADYLAKSPHPDVEHLQALLDKLGTFNQGVPEWTDEQIKSISVPTLLTVGDNDGFKLEHAVKVYQLLGGDVNADFVGLPVNQLAVIPGSTHFFGLARTELFRELVTGFLDAPEPEPPVAG